MFPFRAVAIFLILLLPSLLHAGGRKPPPLQVSFHLQGNQLDGDRRVFMQEIAGEELYFRVVPEVTQKNFAAFTSFPADDESTYGAVFQLHSVAAKRFRAICNANRGKYLLAMVNGQVRDAVIIDQAPNDSFIVIWQRIGASEIRTADQLLPRIGQDPKEWKKSLKKK